MKKEYAEIYRKAAMLIEKQEHFYGAGCCYAISRIEPPNTAGGYFSPVQIAFADLMKESNSNYWFGPINPEETSSRILGLFFAAEFAQTDGD